MNWEDINKKNNFDFNRLIMCMPDDVRKEMHDLVKLYPTETTKEAADRVYYDQMPEMMFMLPKANNERK